MRSTKPSKRFLAASLLLGAVTATVPLASAHQGPLRRAGQALENAGRNIRQSIEADVNRGRIVSTERDILARVNARLRWDKQLLSSTLDLEVFADGKAILRGVVADEAAKKRAVDLTESTVGVTSVVDELTIGKAVQVIETVPAARVITAPPARVITTPPAVVVPAEKVVVPSEKKVIVTP